MQKISIILSLVSMIENHFIKTLFVKYKDNIINSIVQLFLIEDVKIIDLV